MCKRSSKKTFRCVIFLIIAVYLIIAVRYSGEQSFWSDELYQIKFSGCNQTLLQTLLETETSPPLYRLIANVWYRLMPYGEQYLILLSEIFVAVTILVVGFIGKLMRDDVAGYIVAALYAFNVSSIENCAYEFRPYSLMCLLSAVVLYVIVKKNKSEKDKKLYYVIQGIAMVLLCYTHYYGLFLCIIIGLFEVIIFIKKKELKAVYKLIPYGMCVALYLPWVFRVINMQHMNESASWHLSVSLQSIWKILKFLFDQSNIIPCILLLGIVVTIIKYILSKQRKEEFVNIIPVVCILGLFGAMSIYGTVINKSATLWVERYFLVLLPFMIITIAMFIYDVGYVIGNMIIVSKFSKNHICKVIITVFFVGLAINAHDKIKEFVKTANYNEDFRGAADWLYETQKEYINKESTIVYYPDKSILAGWDEYYIRKQGNREAINVDSSVNLDKHERIYACVLHFGPDWDSVVNELRNNTEYELVEENTEYKIFVFQKIKK